MRRLDNPKLDDISAALENMKCKDIYSLMLFVLYKLRDNPEYLTLTELAYILEGKDLTKFLSYYGGMTIQIPTLHDMKIVFKALSIYQYVNLEGGQFRDALSASLTEDVSADEIKEAYKSITQVMGDYNLERFGVSNT